MGYTFVLVHGSWHDNRAWQPVINRLEQSGHKVYAPTVAGHAPNDRKDVTHADCVRSVVDFIKASDVRDFILVGHSFGGAVAALLVRSMISLFDRLDLQATLRRLKGHPPA